MLVLAWWRRRRRRSAEDAALLDTEEREANETVRAQKQSLLTGGGRPMGDYWERVEDAEFRPPKY